MTADATATSAHVHHPAPSPMRVSGDLADGVLEIVDTPDGERLRFTASRLPAGARVIAMIDRPGGRVESLALAPQAGDTTILLSSVAPAEPHEFDASLHISAGAREEALPFRMVETVGHRH